MKILKSLLVTLSCSAIALSIGIPTIAETVKDSQIKLEPTGIGNKDYRNKQSTPSMVGSWKSGVQDNEYRHTDPQEIYFDMASGGSTVFAFRKQGQADGFARGDFRFTPTKDADISLMTSIDSNEEVTSLTAIKWISNNEFVIRILKNPEAPHREGVQRRFVRIQEPVATILQQKAQQAAKTQKPTVNDYTDYNQTVNFGRQLPGALRGLSNWSP